MSCSSFYGYVHVLFAFHLRTVKNEKNSLMNVCILIPPYIVHFIIFIVYLFIVFKRLKDQNNYTDGFENTSFAFVTLVIGSIQF